MRAFSRHWEQTQAGRKRKDDFCCGRSRALGQRAPCLGRDKGDLCVGGEAEWRRRNLGSEPHRIGFSHCFCRCELSDLALQGLTFQNLSCIISEIGKITGTNLNGRGRGDNLSQVHRSGVLVILSERVLQIRSNRLLRPRDSAHWLC